MCSTGRGAVRPLIPLRTHFGLDPEVWSRRQASSSRWRLGCCLRRVGARVRYREACPCRPDADRCKLIRESWGTLLIGQQNHVFDEHTRTLQIYWSNRDVIGWLAENSDDDHLKKVHRTAEQNAVKMEVVSGSVHDEEALFEEDDDDDEIVLGRTSAKESPEAPPVVDASRQRLLSMAKMEPVFEGLKTPAAGHKIQEIKELMSVPVCILYRSPDSLLTPKPSGHCHSRFDQEPTGHQGLQRQPLCQSEQELNVPYPNACFPIPRYSFLVVLLPWLRYSRTVDPSRSPQEYWAPSKH